MGRVVFNWKRAGRLFCELLLQERRGIMEYCNGCGKDTSCQQEKKRRRLLSSTGLRTVLHTLKKFYSDLTQESMEELLPRGFICRSCLRVIERYNSVHQEVLSNMKEVLRIARSELQPEQVYSGEVPCQQPDQMSPTSIPYGATQNTDAVSPAVAVNISKYSYVLILFYFYLCI